MLQFTLKQVREACGYSIEEVANYCGITEEEYVKYGKDFEDTPARIAYAIRSLFKVSLDAII